MTYSPDNFDSSNISPDGNPRLSSEAEQCLFQAAGRRVLAVVQETQPERMQDALAAIADVPIYGAFVSLKRGGQLRSCCGYISPAATMAEAVGHAADRAAIDDPRFPPIAVDELNSLDMEVWILWGPEEVAARGEDRVREVIIGKHGLVITRGSQRGLLLPGVAVDHNFDARTFLQQTCMKAGLSRDVWLKDDTQLLRFEGYAIHGRLSTCRPRKKVKKISSSTDRPPAVAGTFYPSDPDEVKIMVQRMLGEPVSPETWAAAMVPHAGWVYSGQLAARVWRQVKIPSRVIILCPKHRPGGAQWAVANYRKWLLPGVELDGDPEFSQLLAEMIDNLELDDIPHKQEHAIEVQLPFLAQLAPQTKVIGITTGAADFQAIQQFASQLAGVVRDMPERPLLIISSDMNHFADDAENRILDRIALDAIETLDPAHVFQTVQMHRISMCGLYPCVIVMEVLRQLGSLNRSELVGYATSAETSRDRNRVVGYAGMLFGN